jgi:hypothetical protein
MGPRGVRPVALSGLGAGAQSQDGAPGAALAGRGSRRAPGRRGQVAELAGQAVLADVGSHVAVPVLIELGGEVGVGVHGGLLSAGSLAGMLGPFTNRLPGGWGGHHT